MLGNIKPLLGRLSPESRRRYQAYYCGLCDSLGKRYGQFFRMGLRFDMVFIAMVRDDINGEDFSTRHKGCVANPFKKKDILKSTAGTALAADVLALLAYYKAVDDIQDEKWYKKPLYALTLPYFYLKMRRAKRRRPRLYKVIDAQCKNQPAAERENPTLDKVSMPTAKMCRAIFRRRAPENYPGTVRLGQFGFFLGRVIYLLDALKDMREDREKGSFNIFNLNAASPGQAARECYMAVGEMAYWYKQNNFTANGEIIENIIYLALGQTIEKTAKADELGE